MFRGVLCFSDEAQRVCTVKLYWSSLILIKMYLLSTANVYCLPYRCTLINTLPDYRFAKLATLMRLSKLQISISCSDTLFPNKSLSYKRLRTKTFEFFTRKKPMRAFFSVQTTDKSLLYLLCMFISLLIPSLIELVLAKFTLYE